MHEVINQFVWPHLAHVDAPWYPVKNRSKHAWLDMKTHVLGYPNICVRKSICKRSNAVLEQMFTNFQDYSKHKGSLRKPRRQRQRECRETKGLMSRTIAVHLRYKSLYISLPSSAKQEREMTKFFVVWRTWTPTADFLILFRIYRCVLDSVSW